MSAGLADAVTVCDTKPGLAAAFAEELKHVSASLGLSIQVNACERDEEVSGADIILISAGEPRNPGVKMTRRDLAANNAKIVKHIAETVSPRNPGTKYIVITNPVDAMAMVCKKYSKADFVISTGTNLESLRFRSKLSSTLEVPVSQIRGWVGGEHGDAAVILWSTVKINGISAEENLTKGRALNKAEVEFYMKSISKFIIDNIGGTEYGPAASFRDIVRAIVKNTNEVLSIATPLKFKGIPEPVLVGTPVRLGRFIGLSTYDALTEEEKEGIAKAATAIHQTYKIAIQNLE
jgi:malate dehydrogenase